MNQDIKQIEDLEAMRQDYRQRSYNLELAEKFGTTRLDKVIRLHRQKHLKKSLIKRLINKIRRLR